MPDSMTIQRMKLSLRGLLQGVGFRPYVYQLAQEMGVKGWVQNSLQGVSIEAEGHCEVLGKFLARLKKESPPSSVVQSMESFLLEPLGYEKFEIRSSDHSGVREALVLPDIATCPDCLSETFDPANKRYLYPFTNCNHCGPRFSIIEALPYDRENTSMKTFQMCEACQQEYENPEDRRFHAQPNACPDCGPQLELWGPTGSCLSTRAKALEQTVKALQDGKIVAVKGLGGFHLMVNACNDKAVQRLRCRKKRKEKPFALMFPAVEDVKDFCTLSALEDQVLRSPAAPIMLLQRRLSTETAMQGIKLSRYIAPLNPNLGVMLPPTPLHHILMMKVASPVVATSANISDETICADELEALKRLQGVADFYLVHNRPIVRHGDDSIVRVVLGAEQVLRCARGYAPTSILLNRPISPLLGVGGFLKNSVALAKGQYIFVSQHIGALENPQTVTAFNDTLESMTQLYDFQPSDVACDYHPDYPSTHWADMNRKTQLPVQHHVAHVFSCMAEHDLRAPLLGVAWDGSGYGLDGTSWGGEFFKITKESIHRIARWRPFPLPGGDAVTHQPRRSALGLLYEVLGETVFSRPEIRKYFSSEEIAVLATMLGKKINSPMTSSCGRLFDAVASLIGIRQANSFEGQAAMELEFSVEETSSDSFYSVNVLESNLDTSTHDVNKKYSHHYDLKLKYQLDATVLVDELLEDISANCSKNIMATKFHNALVESIVAVAKRVGEEQVVLSGGCFQNKYLTEKTVDRLRTEGFRPHWHQRIPPNDGGLSLGQIYAASWFENRGGAQCV
ncbi:MAG: carbamoyltransferase HypF [Nitrospina sp.]|nr:carbamoyltransferase HypF [Nitrospina sp.]